MVRGTTPDLYTPPNPYPLFPGLGTTPNLYNLPNPHPLFPGLGTTPNLYDLPNPYPLCPGPGNYPGVTIKFTIKSNSPNHDMPECVQIQLFLVIPLRKLIHPLLIPLLPLIVPLPPTNGSHQMPHGD